MAQHLNRVSASVLIGVGAAFDFHAGLKRQAPKWMQQNGLEWFFRLINEPRRLWRRYLVNNPAFVWMTLIQIWRARSTPSRPNAADHVRVGRPPRSERNVV
jgi:N-acetylglucosaminyldiphosphoundecaprenol N-acetyl-beta-D-mannosaminyltransferase